MISNIENGQHVTGDGMNENYSGTTREMGIKLWKKRERDVLYSLVNCCVLHQDYESAVKCLNMLKEVELPENMSSLFTAFGRVYLQLGNLSLADNCFSEASKHRQDNAEEQLEAVLDSAFLAVGQGQFQTALEIFLNAEKMVSNLEQAEGQAKMINNNIAVCLLYVGRLKEGLERLEKDITQDPSNIQVNIDKTLIIFLSVLM